jgi:hypothetical protein
MVSRLIFSLRSRMARPVAASISARLEKRSRARLLCLLCAEAGWLILVNAWLRLERTYLKLRLFLRV